MGYNYLTFSLISRDDGIRTHAMFKVVHKTRFPTWYSYRFRCFRKHTLWVSSSAITTTSFVLTRPVRWSTPLFVLPAGLEPTTLRFVDERSNPLSYGSINKILGALLRKCYFFDKIVSDSFQLRWRVSKFMPSEFIKPFTLIISFSSLDDGCFQAYIPSILYSQRDSNPHYRRGLQ